jgi:bifunctional enzyme CysN/CysC
VITEMTGIDSPYEPPESPDLRLDTEASEPQELAERLIAEVATR